jgi:hypothetical protein
VPDTALPRPESKKVNPYFPTFLRTFQENETLTYCLFSPSNILDTKTLEMQVYTTHSFHTSDPLRRAMLGIIGIDHRTAFTPSYSTQQSIRVVYRHGKLFSLTMQSYVPSLFSTNAGCSALILLPHRNMSTQSYSPLTYILSAEPYNCIICVAVQHEYANLTTFDHGFKNIVIWMTRRECHSGGVRETLKKITF